MKSLYSDQYQKLTVQISIEERELSKKLAKTKGMTYAGWLGSLVKRELRNYSGDVTVAHDHAGDIRDGFPL